MAKLDIERLEKEIGERIDAAVKADPRERDEIAAELGITESALQKIQEGKSTTQFAKLAQLADILCRTPNELLGFAAVDREILRGAIEGACEGFGHPQIEAQVLASTVLTVIETPEVGGQSSNPLERARSIAKFLTQQSSESRPR